MATTITRQSRFAYLCSSSPSQNLTGWGDDYWGIRFVSHIWHFVHEVESYGRED
jgi:hypothetical protein